MERKIHKDEQKKEEEKEVEIRGRSGIGGTMYSPVFHRNIVHTIVMPSLIELYGFCRRDPGNQHGRYDQE